MKTLLNNTFKPLIVVGTCIALMLSATTYADQTDIEATKSGSEHHHMKKGHKSKAMMKKLDLTNEQKQQIKVIKSEAKSENEALLTQMKTFKEQEKVLLQSDVFNEGAYIALLDEYQSVHSQLKLNKAKNKHAIRQVLTEEQREKMDKHKKRGKRGKKSAF